MISRNVNKRKNIFPHSTLAALSFLLLKCNHSFFFFGQSPPSVQRRKKMKSAWFLCSFQLFIPPWGTGYRTAKLSRLQEQNQEIQFACVYVRLPRYAFEKTPLFSYIELFSLLICTNVTLRLIRITGWREKKTAEVFILIEY